MTKTHTWTVTMQVVAPAGVSDERIETMIEEAVDASVDIKRRNLDITQVRASR